MPILSNPRHETFAQARAKGARLEDAYEDAGFSPGNGHASRMAKLDMIADRIAELRAQAVRIDDAGPAALIAALLDLARNGPAKTADAREARLALLDAFRLRAEWSDDRAKERADDRERIRREIAEQAISKA